MSAFYSNTLDIYLYRENGEGDMDRDIDIEAGRKNKREILLSV